MRRFTWVDFRPAERAVLCFVRTNQHVLLIEKKRGLGAGKVNGPGGKLDPGESPAEAAVRETAEEVHVRVNAVRNHGLLRFAFVDGFHLLVDIFVSTDFEGECAETPEAVPFWCHVDEVPYHRMGQDDRIWLPSVLHAENRVDGWFLFDGDAMLEARVLESSRVPAVQYLPRKS